MREIVISEREANQRLDKFLKKYLGLAGSGFIYKMLRKKRIKLNGSKAAGNEILNNGDSIRLYLSDETIDGFRFKEEDASVWNGVRALEADEIVYEDENIIVIDKPAGELSQKAVAEDLSINERLLAYLYQTGAWDPEGTFTPGVCNRLDRNTSGIILAGKTLAGTQLLTGLIRERKIGKYYLAVVEGSFGDSYQADRGISGSRSNAFFSDRSAVMDENSGWITGKAYISKDKKTNRVTVHDCAGKDRVYIELRFREVNLKKDLRENQMRALFSHLEHLKSDAHSVIEVELITGKTHQIRAYMSSINHPLVGDKKYGSRESGGYFLRAYKVEFPVDDRLSPELRGRCLLTDH